MNPSLQKNAVPAPSLLHRSNKHRLLEGLVNHSLNIAMWVAIGVFGPVALFAAKDRVQDWMLYCTVNSPFVTDSPVYHRNDRVNFTIHRSANFEASLTGSRLLRRVLIEPSTTEVAAKQSIDSYGIEDNANRNYYVHLLIPQTNIEGDPMKPGRYYFQFVVTYYKYGIRHDAIWSTTEFQIVPDDVPITEEMRQGIKPGLTRP